MGAWSWLFGGKARVTPEAIATADAFRERVLDSPIPVIVDVWSSGCAPCRRLAPVLVDVATAYDGRVRVVTVATDADPALLGSLAVRATPTLIIYRRGAELGRMTGYRPKGWFDEMISAELPEVAGASA